MNKRTISIFLFILITGSLLFVGCSSSDSEVLPVSPPEGTVPSVSIISVDPGNSVSIEANDYPTNTKITIYINLAGTEGVDGVIVGKTNSGSTGSFSENYKIPSEFENESQLVIRMSDGAGYWAYNTFINQSE